MGAATAALFAAVFAPGASAQTTFTACRVPAVGVIYLLAAPADPCLDAAHVKFSWTEGGAPGANSVNSAAIIDGTIVAADVGADALTAATIATDAIGAAELAATAVTNTDLGTGTANASSFLRGDRTWASPSPIVTQFVSGGGTSGTATGTPTLLRTVGNFTKASATSSVYVSFTTTVGNGSSTGGFCQLQIRIDDQPPTGNASTEYGGGVYVSSQALMWRGRWTGLSAGVHTVSIFLRGTTGNSCTEGYLGFDTEVLVEEMP